MTDTTTPRTGELSGDDQVALHPTGRRVEPPLTGWHGQSWHAVGWIWPNGSMHDSRSARGEALCGVPADVVAKFGPFDPDRRPADSCHACGWLRAIATRTVPAWLARLASVPGRELAVAVAEAILADVDRDRDTDDGDLDDVIGLLAAVSAHVGIALVDRDCGEYGNGCDHDGPQGCPVIGLACHACSLLDPSRDHCYRAEATVYTPCSTLLTLAANYGIEPDPYDVVLVAGAPRMGKAGRDREVDPWGGGR